MKRKIRFGLGKKMLLMPLTISAILCAVVLFASYQNYRERTTELYQEKGDYVVRTLASQLDPEELEGYYTTGETDQRYGQIQDLIADLVENSGVERLYVVRPNGARVSFLFDSNVEAEEMGDNSAGDGCALGASTELSGELAQSLDRLLAGETVEPVARQDPALGWMMTAMAPVLHRNGDLAACVMADINMDHVVGAYRHFLFSVGGILLALAVVLTVIYLLVIRRMLIRPLRQLTEAALSYEGGESNKLFSRVKIHGNDELRTLADAFRMMVVEIEINNMEQKELALREQRLDSELQLANELNVSMLPKALPRREEGYPFSIRASIHQGHELACCFYDYFLLDRDRLCIVVGEVPGEGIPQVIYTAMAQATIKSQMRSGLPLSQAMTAAGRQLYEISDSISLNVLVGVLNGATGRFSCINAGQPRPLIMRSGDRYQWVKSLSSAPLGQSGNVVYQVLEMQLRQGDRLFFHTKGLDEIRNREDTPFGEEQLRLSLNRKESCQGDLEAQLQYIRDSGVAFARRPGDIKGYAMLGLEYRRRDRAQAHCLLTADAAGGETLLRFLREQMAENRIADRQAALLMVLADELFALCRRLAAPDSRFMAECAVPEEGNLVVLRLKGEMDGRNPLDQDGGEADRHAAEFLSKNCEQVLFERSNSMDIVTLVWRFQREAEIRQEYG